MQGRAKFTGSSLEGLAYLVEDLSQRLHNTVRQGTVSEIDYDNERVRVKAGGTLTDWLPWGEASADSDATWNPPAVGTQVTVLSQSGDLRNGIVVARIRRKLWGSPSQAKNVRARQYADGATEVHDTDAKTHTITIPAGGKFVVLVGDKAALRVEDGKITLDAPIVDTTGNANVGSGVSAAITSSTGQILTFQNGILVNVN